MIIGTAYNTVSTMTNLLDIFELLIDAESRAYTSSKKTRQR